MDINLAVVGVVALDPELMHRQVFLAMQHQASFTTCYLWNDDSKTTITIFHLNLFDENCPILLTKAMLHDDCSSHSHLFLVFA